MINFELFPPKYYPDGGHLSGIYQENLSVRKVARWQEFSTWFCKPEADEEPHLNWWPVPTEDNIKESKI